MRPDNWLLTEDVGAFLVPAGDFLRSRPALHNTPLTVTERLRTLGTAKEGGEQAAIFGGLERGGKIHAIFYRLPSLRLSITPLSFDQADALAAHLAGLGLALSSVTAEHDTATAFAEAWQRHTNAGPVLRQRWHLYRLGTLTPPEPYPEGRGRVVGAQDREQLIRWCGEFAATVGEVPAVDATSWDGSRFADRHFTFWQNPDGTPVSMAAVTSIVAGMVRVDPIYTPTHLRGRGYAGAVTIEVSRAALAAGATDVVLYTDPDNPTSNALYQRIGYVRVTDFAAYDCSAPAPSTGRNVDLTRPNQLSQ
jgi:predicted GNAT family acetyltransferase